MAENAFARFYPFIVLLATLIQSAFGECPMPSQKIRHGRYIYEHSSDFNLTIVPEAYILQFRCYRGYEKTPPEMIQCQNGQWTDELPRCIKIYCQMPQRISNGQFLLEKGVSRYPVVGSTAHYSCDEGFELVNQSDLLTCSFENGTAVWKGEIPSCTEKETCPDPGISSNGTRKGDCCFIGDVVKYACNKTFALEGKQSISCLPGGKWSAPRPRCRPLDKKFCPDPPNIANGAVVGNNKGDYFRPKEKAEVVCNPGYIHDGEIDDIACEKNFEWEEEFGECIESFCKLPEVLENGSILELESTNSTEFPYKFELSYVCDLGFRLVGEFLRFCDKEGWSGETPYCEAIKCPDPGAPEHGTKVGENFNFGEKVIFNCFTGYHIIGSVERYCLLNGQWSGELTRCNNNGNFCPHPGVPINGMKIGDRYGERDTVTFHCHPNYSLLGSEVRECLSNKTWSGIEAKCVGTNDFDNRQEVSNILKTVVGEKAKEQADELSKYSTSAVTGRIIDINYPGRQILYFIFDVSGSVGTNNFHTSIRFAKALVKEIGITVDGARAGALTFSSVAEIQFLPIQFTSTESVLNAFDNIEYKKGGTATNSALQKVRTEMIPLAAETFGRKNVKSIVIILTDGKANTGGDPEDEAKLLQDINVEIYCVGITGSVLKDGLYKLASKPHNEHVFILDSYKTLDWLIQEITNGTIDYSECGVGLETVEKKQQARIAGGEKAVEPWPWMTAIYFIEYDGNTPLKPELNCGGSIIGKEWILTAAHCLYKKNENALRDKNDIIIKLGLTDVNNHTYLQKFEVDEYFVHPSYSNVENYDYDIALIKLNGFIEFNPYVRPICLPPQELPADTRLYKVDENAFATGWGHADKVNIGQRVKTKTTTNLKELLLPLKERGICEKSIKDKLDKNPKEQFTERMICAGTGQGEGDTCHGDSGGPLMQSQVNEEKNVYWTLVGIVSWGMGCRVVNTYGHYTNVHSLLPFVHNTMNTAKKQ